MRSVQMTKQILPTLKVMPLPEAVAFPYVTKSLGPDGELIPTPANDESAKVMLDELLRWARALAPLRA